MTTVDDTVRYGAGRSTYEDKTLFSGLDILGVIVAAAMLLLPLTAGGTHYSGQGWNAAPTENSR